MKNLKTQFGDSVTADFQENTWTFEMEGKFSVCAGMVAILPKENYDALLTAIKGIANSIAVHPDCTENSEFEAMVSRCREILNKIE